MAKINSEIERMKKSIKDIDDRVLDIEKAYEKKALHYADQARQKFFELEKQVEDKISAYPIQSVGIAFGAGLFAGLLSSMFGRR